MPDDSDIVLQNHERFLQRVIAGEVVWLLDSGDGLAWNESLEEQDREVILFWSDREEAEQFRTQGFADCTVESMSLFDFLFQWLPGLDGDGLRVGTNWTAALNGTEHDALDLQDQLVDGLTDEKLAEYTARHQALGDEAANET